MALPATDTFTGANNDPLSANWTTAQGGFAIWNNAAYGTDGAVLNLAFWNADAFAADQYAQATLAATSNGAGLCVRMGVAKNGYGFSIVDTTEIKIDRFDAGIFTTLQSVSGLTITNGQLWRLEVSGSDIKVFQDGVQRGTTQVDATYTTGSAGLYAALASGAEIDNFEGGNLGAPPVGSGVSFPRWRSVRR
jgi:hypothetical protein